MFPGNEPYFPRLYAQDFLRSFFLGEDRQRLLLWTWTNFNISVDKKSIYYKMGDELLIHSQISMTEPLKFGNG